MVLDNKSQFSSSAVSKNSRLAGLGTLFRLHKVPRIDVKTFMKDVGTTKLYDLKTGNSCNQGRTHRDYGMMHLLKYESQLFHRNCRMWLDSKIAT
ncbi:hypothetical protein HOLleu_35708 [Holothuria leucospilota]|uniref:Uncharacterized protein n=1 Tax=Holothuria leucospilota TaxID=206669 RepID=A0A9Q0YNA3_HOLLE|nr:hypothetical protein HOLleu_35708 [Holothuria leucospilota]